MKLPKYEKGSINEKIYHLSARIYIPLALLALLTLVVFVAANARYSSVNKNVATASSFSQDFKIDVDLKMYYFVIGNTDELPLDQVRTAQELARTLRKTTTDSKSLKDIDNIINLCDNLETSIKKIKGTEGYDARMIQLEKNVYVLTELVQQHLYSYLYHEAGVMAEILDAQRIAIIIEILVLAAVMFIIMAVTVKSSIKISKSITDPIEALSRRVGDIGAGDFGKRKPVEADDEKLASLGVGIEEMAGKLSQLIELNRQEQIRLRDIELSLIQSQINPHFLYNTLDAIVWLIETEKNQEAEEMVSSLSTYFRSFLSNGKTIVTIADELAHVRSYLEIQQVRYKDILDYDISVNDDIALCLIPKMTLQPLVENAIYHGIKNRRGGGTINISGSEDDGMVTLIVSDNGAGMDNETLSELVRKIRGDESSGFGLNATYKRLALIYGDEYTFDVESQPGEGTTVTIRIPFKTEMKKDDIIK